MAAVMAVEQAYWTHRNRPGVPAHCLAEEKSNLKTAESGIDRRCLWS